MNLHFICWDWNFGRFGISSEFAYQQESSGVQEVTSLWFRNVALFLLYLLVQGLTFIWTEIGQMSWTTQIQWDICPESQITIGHF